MECVPNKVELDTLVEWAVCAETGQMVDLDQPRLQLLVDHNVHAEYLEAD